MAKALINNFMNSKEYMISFFSLQWLFYTSLNTSLYAALVFVAYSFLFFCQSWQLWLNNIFIYNFWYAPEKYSAFISYWDYCFLVRRNFYFCYGSWMPFSLEIANSFIIIPNFQNTILSPCYKMFTLPCDAYCI